MLHEATFLTIDEQVEALNRQKENLDSVKVLEFVMKNSAPGRVALVSSFGAESIVLLHMVSRINPNLPILFIDTQMLFKETLTYQMRVAQLLGLSDVRRISPGPTDVSKNDPNGELNKSNADACCDLRKTRPLQQALSEFDTWITGRKRFQSGVRTHLKFFETDGDRRLKVNPLVHWQHEDLQTYVEAHNLPRHPLHNRGFTSIGCAPCTSPVKDGEDIRAGRWRGRSKSECGIHFTNGKLTREALSGDIST